MSTTWIVSANASRARFFAQPKSSAPLEEIGDMANTAVRQRTAETEQDRLGPMAGTNSIHNTGGATPNKTYEPPQTPAAHETEAFARGVAAFLLEGQREGRFQHLCLVASPQFLGVLRKQLDPKLASAVSLEINKDYTQSSVRDLREQIEAHRSKG